MSKAVWFGPYSQMPKIVRSQKGSWPPREMYRDSPHCFPFSVPPAILKTTSLFTRDSARQTSPARPKSCRTCAASLGKGNASTRSLLGSNRRSGLAPKSLTYALSQLCRSVRLLVRVLCGLRSAVHYLSPPPLAKLLDALTGTRRDRDAHWMCTRTLWFTFPAAGRGKWLP